MDVLSPMDQWPGVHAAAVVVAGGGGAGPVQTQGDQAQRFPLASVTKVIAALSVLVEVAAGRCALDDPAGPPGATLAHLLSHAAGLPTDGQAPIAAPGARRIYSNTGIELAVTHAAERARVSARELVTSRVLEPLGMSSTRLEGSAASGLVGTVADLCTMAGELLCPTLLPPSLAALQRTVAFPGLRGVLPGFGRQDPCDWGLGVEVKGTKDPHWSGRSWPPHVVGHFGQLGGFLLADVPAGIAVVTLGDAPFGAWAVDGWPAFTDRARRVLD